MFYEEQVFDGLLFCRTDPKGEWVVCNKYLVDWFDPNDINHIYAYKHLMEKGMWPVGFIPVYVIVDGPWQISLINKMANCWIQTMIDRHLGITND